MGQIKDNEPRRVQFYKAVASLVRAYAAVANDMERAGYTVQEAGAIKSEVAMYVAIREDVRLGAGENVDLKLFEPGMRALLDTYIRADPSETVATFDKGLVELIVQRGPGALADLPEGIRKDPEAVAETIINNVRKTIVDQQAMNPKYYDSMSSLLDALLEQRREDALDYAGYLQGLLDLATKVGTEESDTVYPVWVKDGAQRALYDFGWDDAALPIQVDATIRTAKHHNWVGDRLKERALSGEIHRVIGEDFARYDELFELVKARDEYR